MMPVATCRPDSMACVGGGVGDCVELMADWTSIEKPAFEAL